MRRYCVCTITKICTEQANCTLDDLRLTGGKVPSEGTVEICSNNLWGTIGDGYWNEHGAQVVCRQLGLPWECMFIDKNCVYSRHEVMTCF